jgi:cold shock CspA family protein
MVGKGNKMIAQITTYIDARGFGFLTDSAGEQYFFHVSNFLREGAEGKEKKPKLGEMVSFELADPVRLGNKTQAVKLRPSSASYVVQGEAQDVDSINDAAVQIGVNQAGV